MVQKIKYRGAIYTKVVADARSVLYYYTTLLMHIENARRASGAYFRHRSKAIQLINILDDIKRSLEDVMDNIVQGEELTDQQILLGSVVSRVHKALDYAEFVEQSAPLKKILEYVSVRGEPT